MMSIRQQRRKIRGRAHTKIIEGKLWISVPTAAQLLGVSYKTLRKRVRGGGIGIETRFVRYANGHRPIYLRHDQVIAARGKSE